MLNVVGNAYADNKEKLSKIVKALENDNFVIAYNNPSSVIILEDDPTLNIEQEEE